MNISIIAAHPQKSSFNHAIANASIEVLQKNGHEVFHHDLYAEKFDPLLWEQEFPKDAKIPQEISLHCQEISQADGIIIIHPNWWGQPPAILKGWIDRVIRAGVAYEFLDTDSGEGVPIGLLKANAALIFNTSNTPSKREQEVFGDPLEQIWKNCIFEFCGIKTIYRKMFQVMITVLWHNVFSG